MSFASRPENTRMISEDETLDRLTTLYSIIQKRSGHRAASDDTLLAWAAAQARPDAVRVLDLGSGKGTVAMLLLQRLPACCVTGLEALAVSHDLAIRNARINALTGRWEPRLGDLRDPLVLADQPRFDLVTGAPPFMPVGSGVLPKDPQRAAGRFELRGGIRDYAEAAARYLLPDGKAVFLMDGLEASRTRTRQAFTAAGLYINNVTTVYPVAGRDPVYRIFEAGMKSGPTAERSFCMRKGGKDCFSAEYEAIRREMNCIEQNSQILFALTDADER